MLVWAPGLGRAGEVAAGSGRARSGTHSSRPLSAQLFLGRSLAPRVFLAAPPHSSSQAPVEAAVKCREGRRRFAAVSVRSRARECPPQLAVL